MSKATAAQVSASASATSKKLISSKKPAETKKAASSKSKAHPPTSEMVVAAISTLKDRKGSSLQAIKKYVGTVYMVEMKKQSFLIKKYLKSAVEKKTIVQAKGNGATGRFKLAVKPEKEKKTAKKTAKEPMIKSKAEKSVDKKPAAKKATGQTKAATKKETAAKKTTVKTPKLNRSKVTKVGKASSPARSKTLKPKKATASKKQAKK